MRPVRQLFIVRHGAFNDRDGNLNHDGISQIEALAQKIKALLAEGGIRMLSSNAIRAKQSAAILEPVLGVSPTFHDILRIPPREGMVKVVQLIESIDPPAPIVVVVTHLDFAEPLPVCWGEMKLDGTVFVEQFLSKGAAWYIDCMARTCVMI